MLDTKDKVPHFLTFRKNYTRRFKNTDLFQKIFSRILEQCYKFNLINSKIKYVNSTHVKVCANSRKFEKKLAKEESMFFEDRLIKEINEQRVNNGKSIKGKNDKNKI